MRLILKLVFAFICFSTHAQSDDFATLQTQAFRGVVKIINQHADVFSAHISGTHGTGFLISNKNGKGIIFTNRHVTEKGEEISAQEFMVSVSTISGIDEQIPARLAYVSPVHDFAVLEINMSDLRRSKSFLKPLKLPGQDSPWKNFVENFSSVQGQQVFAVGNPFETDNAITFGYVTGLYRNNIQGPMIQTQTPINPGNSGGPLMSSTTGEVIGINTSILENANSTGFALPIGTVMAEYEAYKSQPDIAYLKDTFAAFMVAKKAALTTYGLDKILTKFDRKYFDRADGAILVEDADAKSNLVRGDMIYTVSGVKVGASFYNFRILRQSAQKTFSLQVIRKGELVNVEVPIVNSRFHRLRRKSDYVYISGLLFQELSPMESWMTFRNADLRVFLSGSVSTPEVNYLANSLPFPGSMVEAVSFGGKEYPVKILLDLKKALRANPSEKRIKLIMRNSISIGVEDALIHVNQPSNFPAISALASSFVFPLSEVLTSRDFSLHKFRKQFGFEQYHYDTRNWRAHIRKCEDKLVTKRSY